MPKCKNCGTEFEGKFCPQCGTEYGKNKVCPKCGGECADGAKFCPLCGYAFDGNAKSQPTTKIKEPKVFDVKTTKIFDKIHVIIAFLPVVCFMLFSIVLFFLFFAPAAIVPDILGVGETENLGNMYAAFAGGLEEIPIRGSALAIVFFAMLAIPIAFLYVLGYRNDAIGEKRIVLMKLYKVPVNAILEIATWVIYFVLMIISSVIIGTISAFDGGAGLVAAGACPITVLVFSILLLVLSVGCRLFDNLVIIKNFPQFKEEIKEPTPYKYPKAMPKEPKQPEAIEKPSNSPLYKDSPLYKKEYRAIRRFYSGQMTCNVLNIFMILIIIISIIIFMMYQGFGGYALAIVFAWGGMPIIGVTAMLSLFLGAESAESRTIDKNLLWVVPKRKIAIFVSDIGCLIFSIIALVNSPSLNMGMGSTLIVFCVVPLIGFIAFGIFGIIMIKQRKKFCALIYATELSANNLTFTEYGNKFLEEHKAHIAQVDKYNKYLSDTALYERNKRAYKWELKNYAFEKAMCEAGVDYKNKTERIIYWLSTHKPVAIGIALILLVLIILAVALPAALMPAESIAAIM